jgi:PAS domain-containing protein
VKRRRKSALLPALAAVLTLPAAEDAAGEYFVLLFAASMLFLFFRSTYYVLTLHRSAQGISARSVKAALDTLPAGLLFCSDDGTVLMQNRQMQLLMKATTGIMFRNGDAFSDRIRNGDLREDCSRSIRGDITVVRLPDGTVWSFKTRMVGENEESGRLLTAADITERWNATEELDRQRRRLQDESDSLHAVLKELESLYTIRETELMQASLHDIMGQKISLLLRAIRENKTPDEELLKSFTRDFLSEFENPPAASPSQALKALQDTYSALSVSVIVKGRPADDPEAADVQMKTTFEAVTNAVRHGYADEIVLVFSRTKDCWRLDITDDGIAPEGPIREGGGLSEIRRRVQSLGGSFSYRTSPGFSLTIQTPAVPGSSAAS